MPTKKQLALAKLQARIATQRRRVERLMVQGVDPEGAEAAADILHGLETAAQCLADEISGEPGAPVATAEDRARGRASMTGKPRKARARD